MTQPAEIETILFDMGNVLVFFSHDRMCQQLGELCGLTGPAMRKLLLDSGLQWDFERGRMSEQQFCAELSSRVGKALKLDDVRRAASDIFDSHDEMLPVLDSLRRSDIRLVLLSNTSLSHFNWIQENFRCLQFFDDYVLSYESDAIKPEAPIYQRALERIHCDPAACFYTDDIPAYVEAGRQFGLQAEVFTTAENLKRHLAARNVRV